MKTTIYQQAKAELKEIAKQVKKDYPKDLPAQRMIINNSTDLLCKSLNLSEYQRDLLASYSCTLHPNERTTL